MGFWVTPTLQLELMVNPLKRTMESEMETGLFWQEDTVTTTNTITITIAIPSTFILVPPNSQYPGL